MSWSLNSKICTPSWLAIIIGFLLLTLIFAHAWCSCRKNYLEGLSTGLKKTSTDGSGNSAEDGSGNSTTSTSSTSATSATSATSPTSATSSPLVTTSSTSAAVPAAAPASGEGFTTYNVYNKSPYNEDFSSVTGWTSKVNPSSWAKPPTESSMNSHIVTQASRNPEIDPAWQMAFEINKMNDNELAN